MSNKDFHVWLILLVDLVSVITSSCLCSISCPCGANTNKVYTQCINNSFNERYTCERWSNCLTCEANTNYCITCPPGRSGPTCTEALDPTAKCPDPGSIQNGYRRLANGIPSRLSPIYSYGQTFQYFCNEGYELRGNNELTCLTSRIWSSNVPWCQRLAIDPSPYCPEPGQIPNGFYRNSAGDSTASQKYAVGESVIYSCQNGYDLLGSEMITCTSSGSWPMKPVCRRSKTIPKPVNHPGATANCPDPGSIQNGYRRLTNGNPSKLSRVYNIGQAFQYFCNEGYELQGKSVLTCSTSGEWSSNKPWCQSSETGLSGSYCPFPVVNITGMIIEPTGQRFPPGTDMKFDCAEGYKLEGNNIMIYCTLNGEWSSKPPTCRRTSTSAVSPPVATSMVCPHPVVDPYGDMEEIYLIDPRRRRQGFEAGSQVGFTCRSGYELNGASTITCLTSGQWTSESPTCTRISDGINCGSSKLPPGTKITQSRNSQEGEFPWIVLISVKVSPTVTRTFTGILLDHTTVLTVAHYFQNAQHCTLYFGKFSGSSSNDNRYTESRESSQIIKHPEYNPKTHDNDIAIVKFITAVSYSVNVQPICAPTPDSSERNIVPGQTGYLIGWGFIKENRELQSLIVTPLPIKATQTCVRDFQRRHQVLKTTPGMFCAGFTNAQKRFDVCYEGSGAAALVFYNSEMNHFTLEGIASHSTPGRCQDPGNPIIFMRVSHYVQWILQYLEN